MNFFACASAALTSTIPILPMRRRFGVPGLRVGIVAHDAVITA